jgi:hypothetical protein
LAGGCQAGFRAGSPISWEWAASERGVRGAPFTDLMALTRRERDPASEREEIRDFVGERPEVEQLVKFNDDVGRVPVGPAQGWRARARRAKTCDFCEGDLWIEDAAGDVAPCSCRDRRARKRAESRLQRGGWWRGTSLSFAAPPLATIPVRARDAVEALCADTKGERNPHGAWIVGGTGSGKSALCAYMAQRLYRTDHAAVERTGDLLAHLRWLGAVKGEAAIEERMLQLAGVPLLVLDDIDRTARSHSPSSPLAMRESCASQDLIRLASLLRDRQAAMLPTAVTSRVAPSDCAMQTAAITRSDLVRGLLAIASGQAGPFEDFPKYPLTLLENALRGLCNECTAYELDLGQSAAVAA